MFRMLSVTALAVAASAPLAAIAQGDELTKIREEIRQLREAYEGRIQNLERRLAEAEARAVSAEPGPAPAAPASPGAQPARESSFNPAISLILLATKRT